MSVPNGEKEGMRFIVWTKIVYLYFCTINTDNGQENIANIIEARNKYRMLRTRVGNREGNKTCDSMLPREGFRERSVAPR